ncbi:MAG: glycosyltransferase family 39 protein [archaeon]|nr:glycosyltransferase family 39 protein [archaeon]
MFWKLSIEIIYLYSLILLILLYFNRKTAIDFVKQLIKEKPLSGKTPAQIVIIISILSFLFICLIYALTVPPIIYDSFAYHVPIINDIADNGQKTHYLVENNIYENRVNNFPFFWETAVGGVKFYSEFFEWKLILFVILAMLLLLIVLISDYLKINPIFGVVFFSLSNLIIIFGLEFLSDIFLTMLFLGSAYLMFKFIETNKYRFLILCAFGNGLMILTKFTGIAFFCGFAAYLFFKKGPKVSLGFSIIALIISATFYLPKIISGSFIGATVSSLGIYGDPLTTNVWTILLNLKLFIEIIGIETISSGFFILIPFALIIGFLTIQNKKQLDVAKFLFLELLIFVVGTIVNKGQPNFYGTQRYIFPIFALSVVFTGLTSDFLIKRKGTLKKIVIIIIVGICIAQGALLTNYMTKRIQTEYNNSFEEKNFGLRQFIPNNENIKILYLTGEPLILGMENTQAIDYTTKIKFYAPACDFFRENNITHLVSIRTNELGPPVQQELIKSFQQEMKKGDSCMKKLFSNGNWMNIFEVKQ